MLTAVSDTDSEAPVSDGRRGPSSWERVFPRQRERGWKGAGVGRWERFYRRRNP